MALTGLKDLDREVASKLGDRDLLSICSVSTYFMNEVCNDNFLKMRLLSKYPYIDQYKDASQTWRKFFLQSIYYISLLKEKFNYDYEFGNHKTQYEILTDVADDKEKLLPLAANKGELALIIYGLKFGETIDYQTANQAAGRNRLDIVQYLVKNYANEAMIRTILQASAITEAMDVLKYIVNYVKNNSEHNEFIEMLSNPLFQAADFGSFKSVKYLVEQGAVVDDMVLQRAISGGHLKMWLYLKMHKH